MDDTPSTPPGTDHDTRSQPSTRDTTNVESAVQVTAANPWADDAGYQVLARKYRPSTFDDLIGQQSMVQTLTNAFETGRIAQAYMLTGVRGVGKTTTARILARALNYESDSVTEPSLDLSVPGVHCPAIIEGSHVDVTEMDAASNTGIDNVREIIEAVRYKPVSARYKVYIIDEVHMLTTQAFNGLLKTLEEPPAHVKFIFATTEIRKVPITVLSRCQRFDLRRIEGAQMAAFLGKVAAAENVTVADAALAMLARASEGSVRDALSLLDQAIAHAAGTGGAAHVEADGLRAMLGLADRTRVIDLFEHVMKGDIAAALGELKAQYDVGAEPVTVLTDLAEFVHFVTRVRFVETALDDPTLSEEERIRGKDFAARLSPRVLGRAWQMLLKGISEVQMAPRPLAAADMVLVRLTHAADLPNPDEVIKQLTGQPDQASTTASSGQPQTPLTGGNGMSATASGAPVAQRPSESISRAVSSGAATAMAAQPSPTELSVATAPNEQPNVQDVAQDSSLKGPSLKGPALVVDNGPGVETAAQSDEPLAERPPLRALPAPLHSLSDLLALAESKRDLKFKLMLRNNFSEISFENGRIEFAAVGEAPKGMARLIQETIKAWTGETWEVIQSGDVGRQTLKEVELEAEAKAHRDASADPTVAAILAAFKGAKIEDVRFPKQEQTEALSEAAAAEAALANPDAEHADPERHDQSDAEDPGAGSLDDFYT